MERASDMELAASSSLRDCVLVSQISDIFSDTREH